MPPNFLFELVKEKGKKLKVWYFDSYIVLFGNKTKQKNPSNNLVVTVSRNKTHTERNELEKMSLTALVRAYLSFPSPSYVTTIKHDTNNTYKTISPTALAASVTFWRKLLAFSRFSPSRGSTFNNKIEPLFEK